VTAPARTPLVDAVAAETREPGCYGVACSGGVDSMALAHAAIAVLGPPAVVVVTIDHGLQPTSARVADGVATWAREQGATPIVRRVEVVRTGSLEAAARTARYAALEQVVAELGLVAMLVAHTHRDQAETVLMRIVRGTGPAGLAGMAVRRGHIVRPLLGRTRADTEAYVRAHALPIWDDPMNRDPAITRVRVRDTLLPAVRSENPAADDALVRLAAATREWLDVIDGRAAPLGKFPLNCGALAKQQPAIRKRAIAIALDRAGIGYEATHLEALDRLVRQFDAGEVEIDLPGVRLVRSYGALDVRRPARSRIDPDATNPAGPDTHPYVAPDGPYMLRTWQPGDRMCPVRLKGRSRKLSDLFIDLKLPRDRRAHAHVLIRTTDRVIVWAEHVGLAFGTPSDLAPLPRRTGGSF